MEHFYDKIQGWFTYPKLFAAAVRHFPTQSHFVEIGAWKGKSSAYMAVEIINSNKEIKFDCVDTFEGSEEQRNPAKNTFEPQLLEDEDYLYRTFTENMESVEGTYTALRMTSVEAAKGYEDESLDFVFIDGSHDYDSVCTDIGVWFPKMKKSGVMAGHDYGWSAEVRKAVDDSFRGLSFENVTASTDGEGCWLVSMSERMSDKTLIRGQHVSI